MGFGHPSREKTTTERLFKSRLGKGQSKEQAHFVEYAYSTTQLMHMFHTNLRLYEKDRDALDTTLIQTLIGSRNNVVARNGALRSNKKF